jgi:hypothetical protein
MSPSFTPLELGQDAAGRRLHAGADHAHRRRRVLAELLVDLRPVLAPQRGFALQLVHHVERAAGGLRIVEPRRELSM